MKVLASQTEAASACSYGAGQRTGINYQLHMGRYNGPIWVVKKHNTNLLLANICKWEDMGCTLGTTLEFLLLLQTHKMQKPNVSQGLYPILLLALLASRTSAYTSLGVSQDLNPRPQLIKHQYTTQPHQLCWGVIWWLYWESPGHSSAIDHSQTLGCLIIINKYKTNITPFLKGKMLCWHWWCIYTSSVAIKQAPIKRFGKKPSQEKNALPVWRCIPVHCSYCVTWIYLLGDRVSMHPCEADWAQTGGHYGKARLKEVLHAPLCINNAQHMCIICDPLL